MFRVRWHTSLGTRAGPAESAAPVRELEGATRYPGGNAGQEAERGADAGPAGRRLHARRLRHLGGGAGVPSAIVTDGLAAVLRHTGTSPDVPGR